MTGTTELLLPTDRFISVREACQKVSLGKSTLYRYISEGKFPRPRDLGFRVAFVEREIVEWMAAKRKTT